MIVNRTKLDGMPCLDFVNTLSWRGRDNSLDQLHGYKELIDWGLQSGILSEDEYKATLAKSLLSREKTAEAHWRAIQFREALYRILITVIERRIPLDSDMEILNGVLSDSLKHLELRRESLGYRLFLKEEVDLHSIIWRVALSVSDLLTSDKLHQLKTCASEECGWLFMDTSKNQSRRWCDMKDCGNRMKARRHYNRKKEMRLKYKP